jgi:cold shock CspA family protein
MQGKVVYIHKSRNFGFIWSDELQRRVFFHVSQIKNGVLQESQQCLFELASGKPGLPEQAVKVVISPQAGLDALRAAKRIDIEGVQGFEFVGAQ